MTNGKINVHIENKGGWIRVFLHDDAPAEDLTPYLSHTLTNWIRKNNQYQIRFVIPITRDGNTVEFHAWYQQVHFPNIDPMGLCSDNPGMDGV